MKQPKPICQITKAGAGLQRYDVEFPGRLKARLTNFGATLMVLEVPDRKGRLENIVLGYENPECYRQDSLYLGATVGRFANRIGQASFSLESKEYRLAQNNGTNHLHGGIKGFNKKLWQAEEPVLEADAVKITFRYTSPDAEEGYPGTLQVGVTYRFTAEEMQISYEATTDKATPVSLTNHSYFNLSARPEQDILNHELQLAANHFLPLDNKQLPTGEIRPVAHSSFDFTQTMRVGAHISQSNEQLETGQGYDHYFVLEKPVADEPAAVLYHPESGRRLSLFTSAPGLQLYTGNVMHKAEAPEGCAAFGYRTAICLETHQYPDAPNQPEFPSAILQPGESYFSATYYRFSVD